MNLSFFVMNLSFIFSILQIAFFDGLGKDILSAEEAKLESKPQWLSLL